MALNDFQRECLEALQKVLREKGLKSCQFKEIEGKTQQYLLADVTISGARYEVYIYEDEAGLGFGKQWFICEKPDYDSSRELIQAFSQMLSEKLPYTAPR